MRLIISFWMCITLLCACAIEDQSAKKSWEEEKIDVINKSLSKSSDIGFESLSIHISTEDVKSEFIFITDNTTTICLRKEIFEYVIEKDCPKITNSTNVDTRSLSIIELRNIKYSPDDILDFAIIELSKLGYESSDALYTSILLQKAYNPSDLYWIVNFSNMWSKSKNSRVLVTLTVNAFTKSLISYSEEPY